MENNTNLAARPIPYWRQIAYSLTEVVGNPMYTIMLTYMTFFYTDVLGLNVAVVGMLTLGSRILDGISDIVAGNIIDHTHTKRGSARPWILWTSVMMLLGYVCLFTVPNTGHVGQYIYIFISYNYAMTIAYTLNQAAANALPTFWTTHFRSRSQIMAVRLITAHIVQLVFSYVFLDAVAYFGNDQRAWIIASSIMGCIAFVASLIVYFTSQEHVVPSELTGQSDIPMFKALKALMKNKYWFMIVAIWILNTFHQTTVMTIGTYYATHILHDTSIVANMILYHNIPAIVSMLFVPMLLQKGVWKQKIMVASTLVMMAGGIVTLPGVSSTTLILSVGLRGLGYGLNNGVIMGMLNDTVEYGEWRTGLRTQAITVNASTVGLKLGSGVGTALFGLILGVAGYDGTLAVQPASALSCLNVMFVYVPIAIYVLELIVALSYHLDRDFPAILSDLEVRRKENLATAAKK